jgi:hypothetical protein
MVGTTRAAYLLDICCQRLRQLLKEGRIEGAVKIGRFWQIPLFNGMPRIQEGTRGPEGTWKERMQQAMTRIHINKHILDSNRTNNEQEPIIAVRRGSSPPDYYHQVHISGESNVVYNPDKPLNCGAVLWIEVNPEIEIVGTRFA